MGISQSLCNSAKAEFIQGIHLASHDYKIALFTSATTLSKSTTTYTGTTNEVSSVGTNYTTGGKLLTGYTVLLINDTAILDWTVDPSWALASFTARGALVYNDSLAGKNSLFVLNFTIDYTATNGTFLVTLPAPGEATALVRIL